MTTITTGDQPLFSPEQTFRSHTSAKNILIAVDDSDESARTLHYAGALLRDIPEVKVTLFHVLNPMPRELMEHGGRRILRRKIISGNNSARNRKNGCARKGPWNIQSS